MEVEITLYIFIEHLPNNTFIKISCMTRQESVNSIIEYKSVDSKLPFKIFLCCFSVSLQDDSWKGEKISDIEHAPIKSVCKYSRFLFSYFYPLLHILIGKSNIPGLYIFNLRLIHVVIFTYYEIFYEYIWNAIVFLNILDRYHCFVWYKENCDKIFCEIIGRLWYDLISKFKICRFIFDMGYVDEEVSRIRIVVKMHWTEKIG
jgi:hypothetical protein